MLYHLAEKFLYFASFDVQPGDDLRKGAAELGEGRVVVFCCDVAFREVEFIQQHQDVTDDKKPKNRPSFTLSSSFFSSEWLAICGCSRTLLASDCTLHVRLLIHFKDYFQEQIDLLEKKVSNL